jgi:ATP synthase F1 gamma subunit
VRSLNEIEAEVNQTDVILGLTRAFEGIASMRIAQVKDQTLLSGRFFADLWQIYSQIKVDSYFNPEHLNKKETSPKELMILITSEGSLSGDVDERLVRQAAQDYKQDRNDIIVIGSHGIQLMRQHGLPYVKSYSLPHKDKNINVSPLLTEVQKYSSTVVYYESYISIMVQEVKTIQLATAVTNRGRTVAKSAEYISESNYIFEPSTYEVVSYLERVMMQIMLSELILESKLAQYASRFKAMTMSRQRASESLTDLKWSFSRYKRHLKDDKLKNIISSRGKEPL